MNLFWFGWDTFSSVIEVITIYFLFEKQLANCRLRISHIIGAIIVFIAELILHILHIDDILLFPVRFVLYLGYACSVFESEKNARIIWGCIAGIMRIAAQIMAYGIASLLDYGHYAEAWFPGSFYFYTEATTTVIYVLITVIATNISNRSNYKFKSVHVVLLIGVCFICIIATSLQMRVVYTLSAIAGTQITQKYAVLVCVCFLVVLVLIVWMINSLGKESYRNMEKTLELQQARVEGNYYRDIPKAGIIYCNKKNINDLGLEYHRQKNVSFVFQNYNLIDYMTPAENVLLSGKSDPFPILERLGLSPEESRRSVLKLSGGQQQRVAIARALASQSSIILADEPTGNLDEENAKEIAEVLKDSARRDEKCVIIVTHSKDLVEISDVVYELQDGVLKTKQYCGVKPTI